MDCEHTINPKEFARRLRHKVEHDGFVFAVVDGLTAADFQIYWQGRIKWETFGSKFAAESRLDQLRKERDRK